MTIAKVDPEMQPANGWGVQQGAKTIQAGGQLLGLSTAITPAAGSSNICNLSLQVTDLAGNAIAQVFELDVFLSDSSAGAGLTATVPSGGLAVTTGTQLQAKVAGKMLDILTNSSGLAVIAITDTSKTGYYPVVVSPGTGTLIVGAQLVAANYG
jgi:hypothetical protein